MSDPIIGDNKLVIRSSRPLTQGRIPYTTIQGFLLDDPEVTLDALKALIKAGPAVAPTDVGAGMMPYLIESNETFTIAIKKQGLFSQTITVEGTLVVNGYLIQVS